MLLADTLRSPLRDRYLADGVRAAMVGIGSAVVRELERDLEVGLLEHGDDGL